MRTILMMTIGAAAVAACAPSDSENSPTCAITMMASANRVLDQLRSGSRTLNFAPDGLKGTVAARVVGYGTQAALAAQGPDGAVVGFEGEGFPVEPGFGLAIVEDSAETFKGVLIFDLVPPRDLPRLGTVSNVNTSLPLFGARISWAAVSNERCPLFGTVDTLPER